MGCVPGALRTDIAMMRPVVAWNLDKFTDALSLDAKGDKIQQRRMELYQSVDALHGKRKVLKNDYLRSFIEQDLE